MKKIFLIGVFLLLGATQGFALSGENAVILIYQDAIESGNIASVKQIVANANIPDPINGQIFPDKKTALIISAENGQVEILKYFLKKGADPTIVDANNKTARAYAEANGNKKIIRKLKRAEKHLIKE